MRGPGVKKLNGGMLEIGGNFEKGMVNGKGYKKWRATNSNSQKG